VFETGKTAEAGIREIYDWKGDPGHAPPQPSLLKEILESGVAYETRRTASAGGEIYLYSLLDSDRKGTKLTFIRSRLNPDSILKKSGGTDARIVSRGGTVLLDTRNPEVSGAIIDTKDPLFVSARQSPVSIGTLEYRDSAGDGRLGTYILPGYQVLVLNSVRASDAMRGTTILLEQMILIGLILLGVALVTVALFSMKLTQPLKELTRATQVISQGNFELALNEKSSDEIGHLSRSMNRMSEKIKALLKESIEKVRIEQELAIASNLQHRLIPPSEIKTERYSLYSHYQSAAECGGDWWGYIEAGNRVLIMISDATGHGLPPAMLTAVTHGCFSAVRQLMQQDQASVLSPSRLLGIANEVILESGKGEINMTMFIALIDLDQKTLTFSNAGHHTPWLLRGGSALVNSRFESLRGMGSRLGEMDGFEASPDRTVSFDHDDSLFLYTDGLIENPGKVESTFGKRRVMDLLTRTPTVDQETHLALKLELESFYGDLIPADDVTYVLFRLDSEKGDSNRA
jgi:sigma-B regulation protein RsbU (phosphoserine phosphatase)